MIKNKKIIIARMVELFHKFNEEHFHGLIPVPQFGIVRTRKMADGITTFPHPKLSIHASIHPHSQSFAETVLHEMVHLNQFRVGCDHCHDGCYPHYRKILLRSGMDIDS